MKTLILAIFILSSCAPCRVFQSEGFYIEHERIYHYSVYGDTTLVNYRDITLLKNDTLIQFYENQNNFIGSIYYYSILQNYQGN